MSQENLRILKLELDIDERMSDLWQQMADIEDWDLESVSDFMRAAYGRGYCDALQELPDNRGKLATDHGYKVPPPRPLPIDPEI